MALIDRGLFNPQTTRASWTTASASNASEYTQEFTTPSGVVACMFFVDRTADTGTCTTDVFLQARTPQSYGGTAVYVEMHAVGVVPQFADGVVTARVGLVSPYVASGDADGVVVMVAAGAAAGAHAINLHMPHKWRLRILAGGTTVTSTQSIWHVYLPS